MYWSATKPSQMPWTDNLPISQVVHISLFCTLLNSICQDVPKKAKRLQRNILNID